MKNMYYLVQNKAFIIYHQSLYNIQQQDYQERKYFDENLNLPPTNNFCLSVTVCAIYRTRIAKIGIGP